MSNKQRILWVLIALAGILAGGKFLFIAWQACFPAIYMGWATDPPQFIWGLRVNPSGVYAVFALTVLVVSICFWLKRPRGKVLPAMLFCGWVLCGLPGQFLVILPHMTTPGDSPLRPDTGDWVLLPDGREFILHRDEARHNPNLKNGYDIVLPDGRRFYAVPFGKR